MSRLARSATRLIARHGVTRTFTFPGTPTRDPTTRKVTTPSAETVDAKCYASYARVGEMVGQMEARAGDSLVLVTHAALGRALVKGVTLALLDGTFRVESVGHVEAHGATVYYRGLLRGGGTG